MNGLLAIEDLSILTLRTSTSDLPPVEIDHRSRMEEEIHPENPVDREAIFHRPHLDLEVLYPETPEKEGVYSLGKDELRATYTSNAADQISVLEMQINVQ